MKSKWKIIRFILLGVILVGGLIAIIVVNNIINQKRIDKFRVQSNKGRYEIGFDTFKKENGKLYIEGWCFKYEHTRAFDLKQNIIVQVVLKNKKDKKDILFLETERYRRDELDTMFDTPPTRKFAAFRAEVSLSKLDLDEKDYDILMFYNTIDGNKDVFGITTDYSIINGEMVKAESEDVKKDEE